MTRNPFSNLNSMKGLMAGLLLFTVLPVSSVAQYVLDKKISSIYINGTSTLHDWTVLAMEMKGSLQAEAESNKLVKIESARISIPVTSLKSEKSAMDRNMYDALKSKDYPEITYSLKSHTIHNGTITVNGDLTVAGVTKAIETKVSQEDMGKHIMVQGKVSLKMSDFNVKPPSLLGGSLKTGDKITISFYFMFREEK